MTFALLCVLLSFVLPVLWAYAARYPYFDFDIRRPRAWAASQTGWRQRAMWAQANAWESFAPFAAAVLIAHYLEADQSLVDWLAGAFVGLRVLHGLFYIADKPGLRALAWWAGFATTIGLFVVAFWPGGTDG